MLIMCGETNLTNRLLSYKRKVFFPEHRLIGNAPTTKIEIDLYNEDNAITEALLQNQFIITEGSVTNGVFFVLEKPQKYTKKLSLELYDNMIKLDIPYKSQLDYEEGTTIRAQLNEMATLSGITITLSDLPEVVLNKTVGWIDTTYSIRTYVGWIAELAGMNAICDYTGTVRFYNISKTSDYGTIDLSDYSTDEVWTLGRVCFDDGVNVYSYPEEADGNTLYITNTNLYFDKEDDVQFIYNKYQGFNVMIAKDIKMPGIDNLRLGQIVKYNNEFDFIVLELTSTFTGGSYCDHNISGELETKESEGTVVRYDDTVRVKKILTTVDNVNQQLTIVAEDVEKTNGKITSMDTLIQQNTESIQLKANSSEVTEQISALDGKISETNENIKNNYASLEIFNNHVNIAATSEQLSKIKEDLEGEIDDEIKDLKVSYIDVQAGQIEMLSKSYSTLEGNVTPLATAFRVLDDGTYTYQGTVNSSGEVIVDENNFTKTDSKGLHVHVNTKEVNWATADGTGTTELSIGESADDNSRWQFRRNGDLLNISWHS